MPTLLAQAQAPRLAARRAAIRAVPILSKNQFSSLLLPPLPPLSSARALCPRPHRRPLARAAASGAGAGAGGAADGADADPEGEPSARANSDPSSSSSPAESSADPASASTPAPATPPTRRKNAAADDKNNNSSNADRGIEAVVEAVVSAGGQGISVILLRLLDGTSRLLPIFVGEFEASSLARGVLDAALSAPLAPPAPPSSPASAAAARPQTYDLLKSTISALGHAVSHVSVVDLRHNTYYACVTLVPAAAQQQEQQQDGGGGGGEAAGEDADADGRNANANNAVELDARPSDALNLAVRCGCPVYVSRDVAERCAQPEALLPPELQPPPAPPSASAASLARPQAPPRAPSPAGAVASALQYPPGHPSSPAHHHGAGGHFSFSSSSQSDEQQQQQHQHQQQHQNHHHQGHPQSHPQRRETHADIVRTARAALAAYRDPTPMLALARDVAAAQERFEAAAAAQALLAQCVTRDGALRLAAAVEAALADGRYGEAARLRDDLLRAVGEQEARMGATRGLGLGSSGLGGGLDGLGGALP